MAYVLRKSRCNEGKIPFYVKDCGMGEKKEGKENEKCSTMPDVLIKGYKILGQHQSQWILMKDAALDKDPQSIIFKVFRVNTKGCGIG